ncbi:MAG TPA: tail fiber domain-containing protein [Pyrinomonadaceae bacterium]|nr:tail fiber domain-containing protein [Pyrinomonadaceae bacterium]
MKKIIRRTIFSATILTTLLLAGTTLVPAQQAENSNLQSILMTEFTYQGRLTDNSLPAGGNYDFEFKLVDANGSVVTAAQQRLNVAVANGIFTVRLDFGSVPFTSGSGRFIEIGVRPAGSAAFTTLSPRQPITSVPYAVSSGTAVFAQVAEQSSDSVKLGGVVAGQYVLTTDPRLSDERSPLAGSGNYIQNTSIEQVADFAINGTGSAGILKAHNINAVFQYSLNGGKFITAPGAGNTFLGIGSGFGWTTGTNNSFFGKNSGQFNETGSENSFFGANSGMNNSVGAGNSFFGAGTGTNNLNGSDNAFFGYQSGFANSSGGANSFFGSLSGASNSTGVFNSFFGTGAGRYGTTASENSFFGAAAGNKTNANANSFFGAASGASNTTGSRNSLFGAYSGYSNTTGAGNSFFGGSAGHANTSGTDNVFFGVNSGIVNTLGSKNTFIGAASGSANTTGESNIFIGSSAGAGNATGNGNIYIGRYTSNANRNGNNTIFIGNDITYGADLTNAVAIGSGANVFTDNTIVLGTNADKVIVRGLLAVQTLETGGTFSLCMKGGSLAGCSSSIRYKTGVQDFTSGLEVIRRLRPVAFNWKEDGARDLGFIAEEVNAVEPLMTTTNEKGEVEGVKYDRVSTALVNAVNEQQAQIEAQNAQIRQQQTVIENQGRHLKLQQQQIDALKKLACGQNPSAELCRSSEKE